MLDPDLAWRLKCLHHQIRCDAAAQKVLRVLREIRDRRLEEKYRPDQPRAPRGTPIGGQWIVDPSSARQQVLRDDRVQVAQIKRDPSFYAVDLEKEELTNRRSHAYSRHVDITDIQLIDELNLNHHFYFDGDTIKVDYKPVSGRFLSLKQANRLVSQVLASYPEMVELAVNGSNRVKIVHFFAEPTGVEAYRAHEYAIPIVRPTFGVSVLIAHESRNSRGYVVVTAFPMNEFPDEVFRDVN